MALEGSNLINSAVVYDTRNSMNTYNRALQKQQQDALAQQKALADESGTVKSDGIREADKPEFYKLFDSWQNKSIEANKERNPQKKMMMQSDAKRAKLDLVQLGSESKGYQKLRDDLNKTQFGKDPYDTFDKAGWDEWMASSNRPIRDSKTIKDPYSIAIIPDTDSFVKDLAARNGELLRTNGKYISQKGDRVSSGNKSGTIFRNIKAVSPQVQTENYMDYLATNRKAYRAAQELYPQLASTLPKEQFIGQVAADLAQKNPIQDEDAPRYEWDFRPRESSGDDASSSNTIDFTESIPVGNKEASIRGMIRFSPTALSLGGLYAYDPETDKQVRIPNVEDGVKVSNLAWYGYSKDGKVVRKLDGKNMGSVKGKMAQSRYAKDNPSDIVWKLGSLGTFSVKEDEGTVREQRVVIDAENLPKDKKDIQKKIKALNGINPNQQSKPQTQSSGKTYSTKFGSFTEADLKSQYGDAWKQAYEKIKK